MEKNINWNKFRDDAAVHILASLILDAKTMSSAKNISIYRGTRSTEEILADNARRFANALVDELKNKHYSND